MHLLVGEKGEAGFEQKVESKVFVGRRARLYQHQAPVLTHSSAILQDSCVPSHALRLATSPMLHGSMVRG